MFVIKPVRRFVNWGFIYTLLFEIVEIIIVLSQSIEVVEILIDVYLHVTQA